MTSFTIRRIFIHSWIGDLRNRCYENSRLSGMVAPRNCDPLEKRPEIVIREMCALMSETEPTYESDLTHLIHCMRLVLMRVNMKNENRVT